jgi:hypothetical protein
MWGESEENPSPTHRRAERSLVALTTSPNLFIHAKDLLIEANDGPLAPLSFLADQQPNDQGERSQQLQRLQGINSGHQTSPTTFTLGGVAAFPLGGYG